MSSNLYDKTTHKLIPIAGNSESTAASLGSLSDVVITSPTNGQHLTFDLATSQWKNADAPLPTIEVNDLSDVTIISVSNGQILKWNSTTNKWENSSFNDITSLGAIPNVDISQVQDGDILVYDTTSGKWINTTLDLSDYQTKNLSSSIAGASTVEGALGAEETAIENEISTRATLGSHNIFDNELISQTYNNVVYTVNSDKSVSITVNSAPASNTGVILGYVNVKAGKSYTLSGGINANIRVDLRNSDYSMWTNNAENKEVTSPSQSYSVETFTPSNDATLMVYARIGSGVQTGNVGTVYPMLRLATDSDSTYQPFAMSNKEITPYVQSISNPNLLDNPWFTVNQRGENSYLSTNGIYTLDRWRLYNGQVDINNDGSITLSSTANNTQIQNRVDPLTSKMLDGRTVTLSAIVNEKIYSHTFTWRNSENYQSKLDIGNWVFDFRNIVNDGDSGHLVRFFATTQTSEILVVKAVKLELGTVSTLAMDTIPNYQQELAKCQRYFVRYRQSSTDTIAQGVTRDTTKLRFLMPLPVPMRTPPSVTASSTVGDYTNTGLTITRTGTNVTYGDGSVGLIQLNAVSSTAVYTAGEARNIAVTSDNFYIDFSADL